MGTQVRLTRSGGVAGLSMVASVDLDTLADDAATKVRTALGRVTFDVRNRPSRAGAPPGGAADVYQYDLVVRTDGEQRSLTAHEPIGDPGLQALLDVLLPLAKPE